jgi:hypothetical protein
MCRKAPVALKRFGRSVAMTLASCLHSVADDGIESYQLRRHRITGCFCGVFAVSSNDGFGSKAPLRPTGQRGRSTSVTGPASWSGWLPGRAKRRHWRRYATQNHLFPANRTAIHLAKLMQGAVWVHGAISLQ